MMEFDKITLAEIVQNNGGSITTEQLNEKLLSMGADNETATNAINKFTQCHLVDFDGSVITFK